MRTSLCLSAVAVLTLGLSACGIGTSKTTEVDSGPAPASQAPAASSAPASSAPAGSKSSAASGASSAPASSGGSSSGGGDVAANQDTPEGAMMMFLRGFGNKDANAVCDVMAIQGKPINEIGGGDMCSKQMQSSLDSAGSSSAELKNAKVSNVKVNGDTADLSSATVTPATAKGVVSIYKTAKKINGKWYVTMG